MTAATITWQDQQKANNLSDTDLSYRVKRRIEKWKKKTELVAETKQAIADQEAEQQQYADKPNGYKYKQIGNTIKELNEFLTDTEAEVAELNIGLCADMDRLVRDAETNKIRKENLKKRSGTKPTEEPATQGGTAADEPPAIPENITDEMKTALHCLNYAPEDVEIMDVATAMEIIKKQKGKVAATAPAPASAAASVPVLITTIMRQQLHSLGYTKEDIDVMTPKDANDILANNLIKQTAGTSGTSSVASTQSSSAVPATVVKVQPKRTEATPAQSKKTQNALLIGLGTAASFIIGIFVGRRLK